MLTSSIIVCLLVRPAASRSRTHTHPKYFNCSFTVVADITRLRLTNHAAETHARREREEGRRAFARLESRTEALA